LYCRDFIHIPALIWCLQEKDKELTAGKEKVEAEMGSNLRGDYYFPTARKRYLPRIRAADEALNEVCLQQAQRQFVCTSEDVLMSLPKLAIGGGGH
jgi:hypothetical protein